MERFQQFIDLVDRATANAMAAAQLPDCPADMADAVEEACDRLSAARDLADEYRPAPDDEAGEVEA